MQIKQSLERMPSEIVLVKIYMYNSKVADVCVAASVSFVSIYLFLVWCWGGFVGTYFNTPPPVPSHPVPSLPLSLLSPFSLPQSGVHQLSMLGGVAGRVGLICVRRASVRRRGR